MPCWGGSRNSKLESLGFGKTSQGAAFDLIYFCRSKIHSVKTRVLDSLREELEKKCYMLQKLREEFPIRLTGLGKISGEGKL